MNDQPNVNPTETTPTLTEVKPARTRRDKDPKPAKRTIEELHKVSPKAMTEAEKAGYIEALRVDNMEYMAKYAMLDHNCKSAYDKCRALEQAFAEYRMKASAKLQFAKQSIAHAHTAITLAGGLEE